MQIHEHSRVTHNELIQRLNDPWLAVVDVLPEESYGEAHIPGAISLPLRRLEKEARDRLDPTRAVIVYCFDDT